MNDKIQIQLKSSSVLGVPLQKYENNFTFHVNGEQFSTSRIVADLLSPTICKIHFNDPTIDKFEFTTQTKGNFSHFLNLITFDQLFIPETEIQFITEIISILGNKSIEIQKPSMPQITMDNICERLQKHDNSERFYRQYLTEEINFISSHFFEITEQQEIELQKLSESTLEKILKNPKLQLKSEDQLLSFINRLYLSSSQFAYLYEFVDFKNITTNEMVEFLKLFDINDISHEAWKMISERLQQQILIDKENPIKFTSRYHKDWIQILYQKDNEFNGIIKYIQTHSNCSIEVTSSSVFNAVPPRLPTNVIIYNDSTKVFTSENIENSWICFDFINHQIVPTNYTIKSCSPEISCANPRCWVIEGSNDNSDWQIIDEQNDSIDLNGSDFIHTYDIDNPDSLKFKYLRMRQTAVNWVSNNRLYVDSIEFYGALI